MPKDFNSWTDSLRPFCAEQTISPETLSSTRTELVSLKVTVGHSELSLEYNNEKYWRAPGDLDHSSSLIYRPDPKTASRHIRSSLDAEWLNLIAPVCIAQVEPPKEIQIGDMILIDGKSSSVEHIDYTTNMLTFSPVTDLGRHNEV